MKNNSVIIDHFPGSSRRMAVYEAVKKIWYSLPEEKRTDVRLSRLTGLSIRKLREEYLPMIIDEETDTPEIRPDRIQDDPDLMTPSEERLKEEQEMRVL